MDARDLVREWPGLSGLGADACLAHPAWQMSVLFGPRRARLVASSLAMTADDPVALAITLDDEPHVLRIAPSPLFPDLDLLWPKRGALPSELLMALVERECGELLQLVEKTLRRQLGVKGFADGALAPTHGFRLETDGGALEFALDLTPEMLPVLGQVDCLDPTHGSVRALTRPAFAAYSPVLLTNEECARLSPGCCIVPPGDLMSTARWIVTLPSDEVVNVLSARPTEIPFAAFADEAMPEIRPPESVALCRHGRIFAEAQVGRLGEAVVLRITKILQAPNSKP